MKSQTFFFIILIFLSFQSFSQVPSGFNYQGIARDAAGNELANTSLDVKLSIITGSMLGSIEWQETHSLTTNDFGLYNLVVGEGTTTGTGSLGSFSEIPWGDASHYLNVEIDFGTGYLDMGTIQLLSVPYSFVSENVINNNDADADPGNELQAISISNDTVFLSDGGFVKLPADQVDDVDADPTNELQVLSTSNDTIYLSNGGFIIMPSSFYDNNFTIINHADIAEDPIGSCSAIYAGTGNVDIGDHDYKITFVTDAGETTPTEPSNIVTISDNPGQILLTEIPVSNDESVNSRAIYRRFNSSGDYLFVDYLDGNSSTTYPDDTPNSSLGKTIPASNSTTSSIQFNASELSGNRIFTLPDESGKLVIDTGNVSFKAISNISIINHGKNAIRQLINGTYAFDALGGEWAEAYTHEGGKNNSVISSINSPLFFDGKYMNTTPVIFFDENSRINNSINSSIWNTSIGSYGDASILNFSFYLYESCGCSPSSQIQSTYIESSPDTLLDESTEYYIGGSYNLASTNCCGCSSSDFAQVDINFGGVTILSLNKSNCSGTSNNSFYLHIRHNGSSWEFKEIINGTTYTATNPINAQYRYITTIDDGTSCSAQSAQLRIKFEGKGLGSSLIYHNIPNGYFSSGISNTIGVPLINDWEEGANIQYKLTNDTEDSGWLNYNVVSSFTPFTSEPTKVIVKLIPKADNPTPGVPAIYGFYVSEF
ncbi:hypothetical protein ACFLQ9_02040 [Bacteroidota bacterium]